MRVNMASAIGSWVSLVEDAARDGASPQEKYDIAEAENRRARACKERGASGDQMEDDSVRIWR